MRTDMKHFSPKVQQFGGIYRGVVEDNNDPLRMGRCRIRIWGIHTDVKEETEAEGIPTDKLPWSEPCLGLLEGSVSGAGLFSVPLQGSHVFLFFEGGNWECPRYFATAPGKPTEGPDTTKGFNDPDGAYPRGDRLNEPDIHRLARAQNIEGTIVQYKNDNLDLGVPTADAKSWSEPESAYDAEYPKNIVLSTHKGIVIEIDNTSGAERVHVFHPSNSYIEIDVGGNMVIRNEGVRYDIVRDDRNTHVENDDNTTVDGASTRKVGLSETIDISNNQSESIGGARTTGVGTDDTLTVGSARVSTVGTDDTLTVGTTRSVGVGTNDILTVGGNQTITITGSCTINATGNVNITSSGNATLSASGPTTIEGSTVTLKGATKTLVVS